MSCEPIKCAPMCVEYGVLCCNFFQFSPMHQVEGMCKISGDKVEKFLSVRLFVCPSV